MWIAYGHFRSKQPFNPQVTTNGCCPKNIHMEEFAMDEDA